MLAYASSETPKSPGRDIRVRQPFAAASKGRSAIPASVQELANALDRQLRTSAPFREGRLFQPHTVFRLFLRVAVLLFRSCG